MSAAWNAVRSFSNRENFLEPLAPFPRKVRPGSRPLPLSIPIQATAAQPSRGRAGKSMPTDPLRTPLRRHLLAWSLIIGGPVGFWCCRPLLGTRTFNYGQLAVLMVTWKIASLLCLPSASWARFTPLRLLAYCVFIGMQPRQFLKAGTNRTPRPPLPTLSGILLNAFTGATLLWGVPRLLPAIDPAGNPVLDCA